ncbi:MAG TPA: hypothetical protein PKK10_01345 [Woeseiaceae bacterium]|nr:hypothetical protein [Woeseiaceae bacterium]
MANDNDPPLRGLRREALIASGLLLFGVLLMPVLVFLVGTIIFGAYDGDGMGDFLGGYWGRLGAPEAAAWFLALSPLIGIGILRLIVFGWRQTARQQA